MSVILKFPLFGDRTLCRTHSVHRFLSVQMQGDTPVVWAECCRTDSPAQFTYEFRIIPTGAWFDPDGLTYIGTYQVGGFVGHVYARAGGKGVGA